MKKVILALGLFFMGVSVQAQNGLEKIIVEKYYVSDATDEANSVGRLPVGSVTYRVYVDMLPGYNFQMAYGDANHELRIYSDSTFYNDEDRGKTTPTNTLANVRKATLMLDSYFSVGGVCTGKMGVLKSDDNDGALSNTDGNLTNNDANAGDPLTVKDGMVAGSPKVTSFIGFDPTGGIFDATSDAGNSFSTSDGSWYILGGATGVDANANIVLIGQFTCRGDFGFNINVQIGTPGGGQENYVHENTKLQPGEIFEPTCSYLNSTVGVQDVEKLNSTVQVYPNPVQNQLNFILNSSNKNISYSIFNMEGKMMLHKELNAAVQNEIESIDVSTFAAGQYIIQVNNGETIATQKFVKIQ